MLKPGLLRTASTAALMIIAATAFAELSGVSNAYANMRAPYHRQYKESGALVPVTGVVLKSEKLSFDFEKYFSGNAGEVSDAEGICVIKAVYTAGSAAETDADFSFISPSGESAEAMINGIPSSVSVIELERTPNSSQKSWAMFYKDLYSIKFSGKLRQGENTITVTYRQPLNINEISYGYFKKSLWSSGVGYEFSPIKEWKRDEGFKAEIEITVPYNWGITDYITGADIELNAEGFDSEYKKRIKPEAEKPVKSGMGITRKFRFTGELPDRIIVSVSEN